MSRLADNLSEVRGRIAAAARRGGRAADDVTLVAVTKSVPAAIDRELVMLGCRDLGESRPQELWAKAEALAELPIRWHFIGHLQRNKVERTLPLVSLVHSADSPRIIAAIDQAAAASGRVVPLLLEVNISGEQSKHGFTPDSLAQCLSDAAALPHIQIRGLMAMAALAGGPERARRDCRALRELRDRLRELETPGVSLDELSMGMSGDFEAAVEEGATLVRVGSALFEGVGE
jgi:PLP dependent protein